MSSGLVAQRVVHFENSVVARAPRAKAAATFTPLTVLVVVPMLETGAADEGAVDLAEILIAAGHRVIVASSGGRLEARLSLAGAAFVRINTATRNPVMVARNAIVLGGLIRRHRCDVVHAHGRAPGWSAFIAARAAGVRFVTTCHAGFRDQHALKRLYNSVMARGDRVIAASDAIAEAIAGRYHVPWDRISVVPPSVDATGFDPSAVTEARVALTRSAWGIPAATRIVLVPAPLIRRKGHHVAIAAARRLKDMGLRDFMFVFCGEDMGRSRYGGELWDLVLASQTSDVVRIVAPPADRLAAYAAASVVAAAAIQLDGVDRTLIEAMAMARPVVASDLAAGPEAVLSAPAVGEDRMTGLRVAPGDAAALAAALVRLLSLPANVRQDIGRRARDWALRRFDPAAAAARRLPCMRRSHGVGIDRLAQKLSAA